MSSEIFEHTHEAIVSKEKINKKEGMKGKEREVGGVDVDAALARLEELNHALLAAKEEKDGIQEYKLQGEIADLQQRILRLQQHTVMTGNGNHQSQQIAGTTREKIVSAAASRKAEIANGVSNTAKDVFPQRLTNLAGIS